VRRRLSDPILLGTAVLIPRPCTLRRAAATS
jgi:hypothetical protein